MKIKTYYPTMFFLLLFFAILLSITRNFYINFYDEALYIMLGKSLAEGHGYTAINLPGSYPHIISPIIFPFALSIFWKMSPCFPQNLMLIKLFHIILCLISVYLTYKYIIKFHNFPYFTAAGIVAMSFLYFHFVYFIRSATTELPYYLVSLSALYSFGKYEENKKRYLFLLALFFLILSFGIRVIGLTLSIAMVICLFIKKRYKMSILLLLLFIAFTVFNATNIGIITTLFDKNNILLNYYTGHKPLFDLKNIDNLPKVIMRNFREFVMVLLNIIFPYVNINIKSKLFSFFASTFFFFVTSGIFIIGYLNDLRKKLTFENLYIGIYLSFIICYPSPVYRYIMPVTPFICLYYFKTFISIINNLSTRYNSALAKKIGEYFMAILILSAITYRTWQEIKYHRIFVQGSAWKTSEVIKASDWLKVNSKEDDLIACRVDPLFYLYSGRKTILAYPYISFAYDVFYNYTFDKNINENIDAVIEGLNKLNVKFLIFDTFLVGGSEGYYSSKLILTIINRLGKKCELIYSDKEETLFIFRIDW